MSRIRIKKSSKACSMALPESFSTPTSLSNMVRPSTDALNGSASLTAFSQLPARAWKRTSPKIKNTFTSFG
jgi:hypothetical protein